jgi:hypothetical protein
MELLPTLDARLDRAVRILAWYRVDPWPRMRRVLVAGPAALSLGGLVVGVSFATREPRDVRSMAVLLGLGLVAGGAGFTLAAMFHLLRDDAYLAIRTDGVVVHASQRSAETLVAWADLSRVRWDERRLELVLERANGDAVVMNRMFARISGSALAEKIEQARRRMSMGLPLEPQAWAH